MIGEIAALSNLGLVIFAGVQIWRDWKRDSRRTAAAAAQASNLGYLLRREIRALIGTPPTRDAFEKWLRDAQNQGGYRLAIDEIRADAKSLASIATDAPPQVSAAAQLTYVHVHEGIRRLEEYAAIARPNDDQLFAWIDKQEAALNDLADCVKVLEQRIISAALLNSELILERRHEDESFDATIGQIVELEILRPGREAELTSRLKAPSTEQLPLLRRSLLAVLRRWVHRS